MHLIIICVFWSERYLFILDAEVLKNAGFANFFTVNLSFFKY